MELRSWLLGWYEIWWDEDEERRGEAEARTRFESWRRTPGIRAHRTLAKLLGTMTQKRFERLSGFLQVAHFESTSNAAERTARAFRQEQRPHYRWRTDLMSRSSLQRRAIRKMKKARGHCPTTRAFSSARGRKPRHRAAHSNVA